MSQEAEVKRHIVTNKWLSTISEHFNDHTKAELASVQVLRLLLHVNRQLLEGVVLHPFGLGLDKAERLLRHNRRDIR